MIKEKITLNEHNTKMIIWIIESESGTKLLFKSYLKAHTDATDDDIVSGFLTAFNQFSMVEFKQSLESIEMGGLRWSYILEPEYKLLFVAADTKDIKTEMLMGRLHAIKKAFIDEFKQIYMKRRNSWDGNIKIFLPFLQVIDDYYQQWKEVDDLTKLADFYDIVRVFEQILIMLRNIITHRMYSRWRKNIINRVEQAYTILTEQKKFQDQPELCNLSFSKDEWFNIIDINPINCDKDLAIKFIQYILIDVVNILKETKGKEACFKFFSEEKIYAYIYNNMKLLKDLNLDMFFLELFLLL
ncbi:MAG: hypothetical protein ACFFAO_19880 [Candidatus Hermodarchaeota archaeon]